MAKNYALLIVGALLSCGNPQHNNLPLAEASADIAERAYEHAARYAEADTEYEWGGQDILPRSIKIDCSGLAVNCYAYVVAGTGYSLPFRDAAVIDFYRKWTVETAEPRKGDLIFMREDKAPTHMSLFARKEGDRIYFIDSTQKTASMAYRKETMPKATNGFYLSAFCC